MIYISYDNAWYTPEQLSMHEYIHIRYGTEEFQKVIKEVLSMLPKKEYNEIVKKVKKAYGDIISNPYAYEVELVCDVLSGMTPSSLLRDGRIIYNIWRGESVGIKRYDVSRYAESIDAGGITLSLITLGMVKMTLQSISRTMICLSLMKMICS